MPVAPEPDRVGDRLALLELVARYAHTVDARDVPGILECFAPDGAFVSGTEGWTRRGHAEIRAFYEDSFAKPVLTGTSTHVMTNTIVVFDGDDAARLVTQAIAYLAPVDAGTVTARGLTYTDRCIRTDDGWAIAERIHRLHWQTSSPGEPNQTHAR